jgi:hypothetical protein
VGAGVRGYSALLGAQAWAVDFHRMASFTQTTQQRISERAIAEEALPFWVRPICCNNCRAPVMTLFHKLEEDVGLFGFRVYVPELIDQKQVYLAQGLQKPAGRAISERGVHFIEQILRFEEERPVAVLHRLQEQTTGKSGFTDTSFTDEDNIFSLGDKFQGCEGTDLPLIDARLYFEREGLERPGFGHLCPLDARCKRAFLAGLPLGAQQLHEQCRERGTVLLGGREVFIEPRGDSLQMQVREQLLELLIHRIRPLV